MGKKIQYAVVARGAAVLAEHGAGGTTTNAGAVARQILERLHAAVGGAAADCRVSYTQGLYVFHVMRADGLTALCMTDDDATAASGRRIPFAFLEDIHGKFVKTYGRAALTALAYAMNDEFSRVLSKQMDYYSNDPNADCITRMKGEMDQVRSIMIDNIDKVLERGDRLEMLVDKTTTMQGNTMRFKRQARRFRNTVWWRNVKLTFQKDGCTERGFSHYFPFFESGFSTPILGA
uniref:Uncharacterized protein n=1 Tax=Aegilops tauschii subsp. strangulata TaxID=200361 RepID=A0A453PYT6_AEGTS